MAALRSPRDLIATLITSISSDKSSPADTTASNPFKDASPQTQHLFLTLHVLFPNELLPALDLLDRGLITRFVLAPSAHPDEPDERRRTAPYKVRSAQPPTRHRSAFSQTPSYEVRLDSWNCSCPAFAFAAFPADPVPAATQLADLVDPGSDTNRAERAGWAFGGLTRGTDIPACKHLLACLLVERCEMFGSFTTDQEVSVEELAGWAAGWAD